MATKITLVSGNVFYHLPENSDSFSVAYIIDKNLNFIGGFLADEADRKLAAFAKLQNVKVETKSIVRKSNEFCDHNEEVEVQPLNMNYINFDNFAAKLGAASKLFLDNWNRGVSDYQDCNGTNSRAQSCDERIHYYNTVGCSRLYKSRKLFPIWAFIANHVSIFGVENFRETFFKGYEHDPQKDCVVEKDTRYTRGYFKAPAAYVRALCG
jgi:hypothetical protein